MYLFSQHPIWLVLKELNLPDEIINIIMGFKTYYSPLKSSFIEYKICLKEYDFIKNGMSLVCYSNEIVNNLIHLYFGFIYGHNYTNNFYMFSDVLNLFIKNNLFKYNEPPEILFNKFIKFIGERTNRIEKTYEILKNNLYSIENIKSIIAIKLKSIISIHYTKKISNISKEYDDDDIEYFDTKINYDYEQNKFRLDMLWYNICYILKNPKSISKTDILMFNYMMGINYKKSWNKKKLIGNLFRNEADNSLIIEKFIEYPEKFNMRKLYRTLKKCPFSSPSNSKGNIKFDSTIQQNYYLSEQIQE